ncbi:MAG: DUF2339 domain-containing protein [candidate division NC10 bacterium]
MVNTTLVAIGVVFIILGLTVGLVLFFLLLPLLILGVILTAVGASLGPGLSERVKKIEERLGEGTDDREGLSSLSPPLRTTYGHILRRLDWIEERLSLLEGGQKPVGLEGPEEASEPAATEAEAVHTAPEAQPPPPEVVPTALPAETETTLPGERPLGEEVPPWERVLGEKWLQWVGLAILATALIFLGGLAFERMTEGQKVGTIFAASVGIGLLGEYLFRRGYRSYSLGMVGGAVAIAYIAALSAFYLFPVLPIATIGATLWSVTLVSALATARYRSPALAGQAMVASLIWTGLLRLETLTGAQTALLLVGVYALFTLLILYHRHWVLVLAGYGLMLASALGFSQLLAPLTAVPLFAAIGFLALFLGLQRYLRWVSFPEVPYATAGGVFLLLFAFVGLIALQGTLTPLNAALSISALTVIALWFDREALRERNRIFFILATTILVLVFFLLRPSEWGLLPPLVALATYTALSHRDFHAHFVSAIALYAGYRLSQGTTIELSAFPGTVGLVLLLYGLIAFFLVLDRRFLPRVASIGAGLAPLIPAFAVLDPVLYLVLVPGLLGAVVLSSVRTGNALQSSVLFGGFHLFVLLAGTLLAVPPLLVWSLLIVGIAAEGILLAVRRLERPYPMPTLAPWIAAIGFPLAIVAPIGFPLATVIPQVNTTQLLLAGTLLAGAILLGFPLALRYLTPRLTLAALSLAFAFVLRAALENSAALTEGLTLVLFSAIALGIFTLWYAVEMLRPESLELETPVAVLQIAPLPLMISVVSFVFLLGGPPLYLIPPVLLVGLAYQRGDLILLHLNALVAVLLLSFYLATFQLERIPVALTAGMGLGLAAFGWEMGRKRLLSTPTMLVAEAYVLLGAALSFGPAVGTTLAWALAGGSLLFYGLVYRDRWVRYGGFVAVFAAVGKIFVADLVGVAIEIRIAALIVVAGLLLLVSFTYARMGRKDDMPADERGRSN